MFLVKPRLAMVLKTLNTMKFTIKTEHYIIAFLIGLLMLDGCENSQPSKPVFEKTVTEEIRTEKDSSSNAEIKNREPEMVNIIERQRKVDLIEDPEKLTASEKEKVKTVNRYQDTTKFKNATIYSEILSEGRVLEFNLQTSIDHLERTIETKEKTTEQAGGLFLSPAVSYSPLFGLESVEANFNYIKGNWGAGIGGYLNFRTGPGVKLTIHKKLF